MHRNTTRTTTDATRTIRWKWRICITMNVEKTKVMVVDNTPIGREQFADRQYPRLRVLGTTLQHKGKDQDKEMQRSIMAGWTAYAQHGISSKATLQSAWRDRFTTHVCCQLWHYGAETWTLTKQAQTKLAFAHTKMDRSMLNITYKDRKTNIWVRERT